MRKKSPKLYLSKPIVIVTLAVIVLSGILMYLKSIRQSPQVALIAESTCMSNLLTFQANNSCGTDGFTQYTYSCQYSPTDLQVISGTCSSFSVAYARASVVCGTVCVARPQESTLPRPTPVVSSTTPTPKPSSSCMPNPCPPGAMCELMALPDGQQYCPIVSVTPSGMPSPSLVASPISTPNIIVVPKPTKKPTFTSCLRGCRSARARSTWACVKTCLN